MAEENLCNQHLTIRHGADWSDGKSADGNITGADGSLLINAEKRRIRVANASWEGEIIVTTVVRGCGVVFDWEFEKNRCEYHLTLIKGLLQ